MANKPTSVSECQGAVLLKSMKAIWFRNIGSTYVITSPIYSRKYTFPTISVGSFIGSTHIVHPYFTVGTNCFRLILNIDNFEHIS